MHVCMDPYGVKPMISLLYFHQFSHWRLRMYDRCIYIYVYILYQHRIVHGLRMNIFTNIGFVRCRGLCGAEVYGPRRKKKKEHYHFHSIRYQIATLMLENSNKINLFYFQESAQQLKKKGTEFSISFSHCHKFSPHRYSKHPLFSIIITKSQK